MPPVIINVLHVEDKAEFARTVKDVLANAVHAQFRVTHVEELAEAKEILIKGTVDIILLDLSLKEIQGLPALLKIQKISEGLPIVLLSGFDDDDLIMKTLQKGAQDFLIKNSDNFNRLGTVIRFAIERQNNFRKIKEELEREKEEMESALVSQNALLGWEKNSVTSQMAGIKTLRDRSPQVLAAFQMEYESLMLEYLESLAFNRPLPRRKTIELADRVGEQAGGPRDLVEIHLSAVASQSKGKNSSVARTFTSEGRLLLVEVLGHLTDYYRMGRTGKS